MFLVFICLLNHLDWSLFIYDSCSSKLTLLKNHFSIKLLKINLESLHSLFVCLVLFFWARKFILEFSFIISIYSTTFWAFYFLFRFSIFIRLCIRLTLDIERKNHYNMLIFSPFLPYKSDIHKPCSQLYIYHKGMCCKGYDNSSKQPLACELASRNHERILCI